MGELRKKYQQALALEQKYTEAPRAGWIEKGSRKRDNEAILVRRSEAVNTARSLATARYTSFSWLYRFLALQDILGQYASGAGENAFFCEKCRQYYLKDWAKEKCPFCAAEQKAKADIETLLEREEKHGECE